MLDFVQQLVSGIALGCVYGLIALGFVLVYKATEVVIRPGRFDDAGRLLCLHLHRHARPQLLARVCRRRGAMALFGMLAERAMVRPILGYPQFSIIMATIGLGYFLRSVVGMIWGTRRFQDRDAVQPGRAADRHAGAGL
jgi:branched-chain amino acid transport system permease protein